LIQVATFFLSKVRYIPVNQDPYAGIHENRATVGHETRRENQKKMKEKGNSVMTGINYL